MGFLAAVTLFDCNTCSNQRSTGFQCLAKKGFEDLSLVTIFDWMLFPNERVCGNRVQLIKILFSERLACDGHSPLRHF